ncbi:nucleoside diphosphate kinase 2 chloroplastic-like, partial [Trifolium pratense]
MDSMAWAVEMAQEWRGCKCSVWERGTGPQQRKEREEEMEAMAVFTGSNISITPSSLLSTTTNSNTTTRRIRITSQLRTSATHLSAFPSKSHLFSSSSTSSYAKTIRTRTGTESGIFLPRLMAALEQVDQTYIMVKPDGVQRGLVGEIISRFEKKGFKLTGL